MDALPFSLTVAVVVDSTNAFGEEATYDSAPHDQHTEDDNSLFSTAEDKDLDPHYNKIQGLDT
jgi:hypothetical protein